VGGKCDVPGENKYTDFLPGISREILGFQLPGSHRKNYLIPGIYREFTAKLRESYQ